MESFYISHFAPVWKHASFSKKSCWVLSNSLVIQSILGISVDNPWPANPIVLSIWHLKSNLADFYWTLLKFLESGFQLKTCICKFRIGFLNIPHFHYIKKKKAISANIPANKPFHFFLHPKWQDCDSIYSSTSLLIHIEAWLLIVLLMWSIFLEQRALSIYLLLQPMDFTATLLCSQLGVHIKIYSVF